VGAGYDWTRARARASRVDPRTGAGSGSGGCARHRDRSADSGGRHGDGRRRRTSRMGRCRMGFSPWLTLRSFEFCDCPSACRDRPLHVASSTNQSRAWNFIFVRSGLRSRKTFPSETRRRSGAHSLRRSPCRRRPLCVHSSTRESFFVNMSAMSASFTVAPVRHAQAIRRSRKATGKVSVRRGVVAKAVEAAPKLVTTKSEAVSLTKSRARYLPHTSRISSRSSTPRGGARGSARRG